MSRWRTNPRAPDPLASSGWGGGRRAQGPDLSWANPDLTRRQALRLGAVGVAGLAGLTAMSGCAAVPAPAPVDAPKVRGGVYSHGATGGGLRDTLDPHFPVTNPDIARVFQLYEPLLRWNNEYVVEPSLAESVEHSDDALTWTVRLRQGVEFHNGKTVTAQDVLHTLAVVTDPEKTSPGGTQLAEVLDLGNSAIVDPRTIRLQLKTPYAILDQLLAEYTVGVIPTDFDLAHPVGTGPFRVQRFVPGQLSHFERFDNYWEQPAYVDELFIYNFADDAAKVNALLAGQVQSIDNLPTYLAEGIGQQGATALIAESGAWTPFTMRVDVAPFNDVRVRQAMRLIVDRQQMIDQALNGYGTLGNDLYAPFDPGYAHDLPQRTRDVDQARSLLRAAGHENLQVELTTSSGIGGGAVESANLFVEQARGAGVQVRLSRVDPNTFYGDQYLSWVFAQDFWNTRNYLPQTANSSLPTAPYNETHFDDPEFNDLIRRAGAETDETRRNELQRQAQQIEFDRGGFIIWGFRNQVDAYSNLTTGLKPHRYMACDAFGFKHVSFVS
ncbi:peptide/nickel transport system substrate-binding protein [Kineosphaera limosa]|uniref:ABC transporter substrate-binding protein n=1 Tax=Kineosphaera limosa TaxID=111564 RepID=UPI0017F95796|nr:ABC transporter substrate-binding protein [Kineosphaera limosa]NYE01324.1 peptide/nickel transport system substrate-binding protein [Kineosphaera limosa]